MPGWLIPGSKVAGVKLSRPPEFFGTAVLHGVAIGSIAVVGGLVTLERKLFGDISPFTYAIAVKRQILQRTLRDFSRRTPLATARDQHDLPVVIYKHNSLIRRKLGNVDLLLQENKAVSLGLAAPHIDGILIRPGETFSFWHLVGHCSAKKGYRMGMTVNSNGPDSGIGGGLCQFTNLLHWMVLHSPLEIVEHHHHGPLTCSRILTGRSPSVPEPPSFTTTWTTGYTTLRRAPSSSGSPSRRNTCAGNCVPASP